MSDQEFAAGKTDLEIAEIINNYIKNSINTTITQIGKYRVVSKGLTKKEHYCMEFAKMLLAHNTENLNEQQIIKKAYFMACLLENTLDEIGK